MISTPLIVAVVVLAVGRVEKSTALFHAFHRPVFHSPEFTIPKPELTLGIDLFKNFSVAFCGFILPEKRPVVNNGLAHKIESCKINGSFNNHLNR